MNMSYCHVEEDTVTKTERPRLHTVAVYMIDKVFGGPEEGGWWYTAGEIVRPVNAFKSEEAAYGYCNRLNYWLDRTLNKGRRSISSMASDGRYYARVCPGTAPEYFPAVRPHYE